MEKARLALFCLALGLVAAIALSCGSSASATRQLQSITLTPPTADAQGFSQGQVQFVATGYYNTSPLTVTPLSAGWGTCYQGASTSAVTVTSGGLAQCASGAVGTYTVWAEDFPFSGGGCGATTPCGGGCFVVGSAQLTCP